MQTQTHSATSLSPHGLADAFVILLTRSQMHKPHLKRLTLRPEQPFTGVSRPSRPEIPKKPQKESLFFCCRKSPKLPKKVKKYPKLGFFWGIFDFFEYFRRLFGRPPKGLCLRRFCGFGPRGPGDSRSRSGSAKPECLQYSLSTQVFSKRNGSAQSRQCIHKT